MAVLKKRTFLFTAAFKLLFLFALLACVELSIRLFFLYSGKGRYVWLPDYYLGAIHAPNSRFSYTEEFSREFKIRRKTNALGFVGEQVSAKKPENIFRVVILGDSFTEGLQVEEGRNFCERLQQLLNKNISLRGRRFEVINAGVSGYSPITEYLFLKREIIKLNPDIVIQQIFANDVFEDHKTGAMSVLDENGLPVKINRFFIKKYSYNRINSPELQGYLYNITRNLLNRSVLFQCINRAINRRYKKSTFNSGYNKLTEFSDHNQFFIIQDNNSLFQDIKFRDKAWANTKKYILATRDLAKNNNAAFLMFYIPLERQLKLARYGENCNYFTQDPNDFLNKRLMELSVKVRIRYFDSLALLEENKDKNLYYNKDGHLTEIGHLLIAQGLFEAIRNDFLPD